MWLRGKVPTLAKCYVSGSPARESTRNKNIRTSQFSLTCPLNLSESFQKQAQIQFFSEKWKITYRIGKQLLLNLEWISIKVPVPSNQTLEIFCVLFSSLQIFFANIWRQEVLVALSFSFSVPNSNSEKSVFWHFLFAFETLCGETNNTSDAFLRTWCSAEYFI